MDYFWLILLFALASGLFFVLTKFFKQGGVYAFGVSMFLLANQLIVPIEFLGKTGIASVAIILFAVLGTVWLYYNYGKKEAMRYNLTLALVLVFNGLTAFISYGFADNLSVYFQTEILNNIGTIISTTTGLLVVYYLLPMFDRAKVAGFLKSLLAILIFWFVDGILFIFIINLNNLGNFIDTLFINLLQKLVFVVAMWGVYELVRYLLKGNTAPIED